jgi:hypothetical protein
VIDRIDSHGVAANIDPMILLGIDWLVRFGPLGDFAVAIRVEDARTPTLRRLLVMRLIKQAGIDPPDTSPDAGIECVIRVVVEVVMVDRSAGVNHRPLSRLWIVEPGLLATNTGARTGIDRKVFTTFVVRTRLAEGRLLVGPSNTPPRPYTTFVVQRRAPWL